jgi:hypothetical protein
MIIETESHQQAVTRQDIITGKKREPYQNETWFPVIPKCYYEFKKNEMFVLSTTIKKKGCKKKAELSLEEEVPRSKRITRSKTAKADGAAAGTVAAAVAAAAASSAAPLRMTLTLPCSYAAAASTSLLPLPLPLPLPLLVCPHDHHCCRCSCCCHCRCCFHCRCCCG